MRFASLPPLRLSASLRSHRNGNREKLAGRRSSSWPPCFGLHPATKSPRIQTLSNPPHPISSKTLAAAPPLLVLVLSSLSPHLPELAPSSRTASSELARMAPTPPPPSTSWVILSREVRACRDGDGGGGGGLLPPEGADLSLELAAPPRVAKLAVSPRVSPSEVDSSTRWKSPCVIAIDPSAGLVLLLAPPPPEPADSGELRSWTDADGKVHTFRVSTIPSPRYFICDVAARTASHVPDPDSSIFNNDLGVISAPGGGGKYMAVEFQFIVGGDEATLLCFSSETGLWEKKRVNNPLPRWIWSFLDVVSHGGKLCWVDTAAGLLFCDPFVDVPHMEYVPLPRGDIAPEHDGGCRGCGYCSERALATRRCVQLSDGKFRCVEMGSASDGATTKVSMHTLVDPGTRVWTLEYAVSFADIWASESYKATGLPEKAPVLALVHPKNPDVVYFFVEDQLVGVDLRAREVLDYEAHKMTVPENARVGRVFSYGLLPMELPPALFAGLSQEGAADGSNGVPSALPASAPSDSNGA